MTKETEEFEFDAGSRTGAQATARQIAFFIWLITAFASFDLITPLVLDAVLAPNLKAILLGCSCGQMGLIAIWSALGPASLAVRWSAGLTVTVLLCWVFLCGIVLTGAPFFDFVDSAALSALLPLIFLSVQVPLWAVRRLRGWHIAHAHTRRRATHTSPRQYRLGHMLATTAAVAIALSIARMALSHFRGPNDSEGDVWFRLMTACLVLTAGSAFSTLPCLVACFIAKQRAMGLAAIVIYAVMMAVAVVTAASSATGRFLPNPELMTLICFNLALLLLICAVLTIARKLGFSLLTGFEPLEHASGGPRRQTDVSTKEH